MYSSESAAADDGGGVVFVVGVVILVDVTGNWGGAENANGDGNDCSNGDIISNGDVIWFNVGLWKVFGFEFVVGVRLKYVGPAFVIELDLTPLGVLADGVEFDCWFDVNDDLFCKNVGILRLSNGRSLFVAVCNATGGGGCKCCKLSSSFSSN